MKPRTNQGRAYVEKYGPPTNIHEAATRYCEAEFEAELRYDDPTDIPPGSQAKIALMAARVTNGFHVHAPGDFMVVKFVPIVRILPLVNFALIDHLNVCHILDQQCGDEN